RGLRRHGGDVVEARHGARPAVDGLVRPVRCAPRGRVRRDVRRRRRRRELEPPRRLLLRRGHQDGHRDLEVDLQHPHHPGGRLGAVFLGGSSGGMPVVGVAFGTGDRDDITAAADSFSLTYPQRYYLVVDGGTNVTRTEADLGIISSSTAVSLASSATKGWMLM